MNNDQITYTIIMCKISPNTKGESYKSFGLNKSGN